MCGPWVQHDDRRDRNDRSGKTMQGKVVAQNWPEVVGAMRKWFRNRNSTGESTSSTQAVDGSRAANPHLQTSDYTLAGHGPFMGASVSPTGLGQPDGYILHGGDGEAPLAPEVVAVPQRCAWLENDSAQL